MRRHLKSPILSVALCLAAGVFSPSTAHARGERVLGAAQEGATLRASYIQKMEKIDLDKKECRKDIEKIIEPELALLNEFGQLGHAGPTRIQKEEAALQSDAAKLSQLQADLIRLGKWLNQPNNKNNPQLAKTVRQFEERLREFTLAQKSLDTQSNSLVERSEKAVTNFVPFARAVLKIKKQQACDLIWADLRTSVPRNMEQIVLNNRTRVKQKVASLRGDFQNFGMLASKLMLRFKTKSQVAVEDLSME